MTPLAMTLSTANPTSGRMSGGLPLTLAGTALGSGLDITHVELCGEIVTSFTGQTGSSVWFPAPSHGSAGACSVTVSSTSFGTVTTASLYSYNSCTLSCAVSRTEYTPGGGFEGNMNLTCLLESGIGSDVTWGQYRCWAASLRPADPTLVGTRLR